MRRSVWMLVLCLVTAGCAGDPEPSTDEAPQLGNDVEVEATDTTGGIRGVVVDDAIRPLAGVLVRLVADDPRSQNTTETGIFSFSGLEPGTYFVEASKLGYIAARQSVEVVAGEREPPVVRMQLGADVNRQPYYTAQSFTGYIMCTSSVVALCGAPNVVSNVLLCPAFGICQGNVTDDTFGFDLFYDLNASYIQSEVVWESTQALSTQLSLQMETIQGCEDEYYERSVAGDSPILDFANATEIAAAKIGGDCSIFHSLFSGDTAGTPIGVTLQQRFDTYSHAFYYYTPADVGQEGWRFTEDGTVPSPP